MVDAIDPRGNDVPRYEVSVILSAAHLESGDVFDFLCSVKNDKNLHHIPFVFQCLNAGDCSRVATDVVKSAAMALGVNKYITIDIFDKAIFWQQVEGCIPLGSPKRDALGSIVKTFQLGEIA